MTAKIYHADIYGSRAHKYKTLLDSSLQDIDWQELSPNAPYYLFLPQEQLHREQYEKWWQVTDIFPVNSVGMQTHRDYFVTDFNQETLHKRIADFRNSPSSDTDIADKYELGKVWDISKARTALRSNNNWENNFTQCLWRPFDIRALYYDALLIDRVRSRITEPMLKPNLAILAMRQVALQGSISHFLVTNLPIIDRVFYSNRGAASVFPLWLYPQSGTLDTERRPNIAPAFLQALIEAIGHPPAPEDVFHYAYAIFHAPAYRTRYAPFLKTDFPRLPLPPDTDTFQTLAALGSKLVALHLLEDPALAKHGIGFPVAGDHTVQKMKDAARYTPPAQGGTKGRVKLNATEYFDNVPLASWDFQVGGYRPASKWLADREGRCLTAQDIDHYRRTLAALRETAALLPQVDAAFTVAFPLPAAAQ